MITLRRSCLLTIFSMLMMILFSQIAKSQEIGRCFDQVRGQAFAVFPNLFMVQIGNPMNQGQAVRDPSGITFMRVPAVNPAFQAFFVDWNANLVEVNPNGMFHIGMCQFLVPIIPPNPNSFNYQPPQMANWGVRTPTGIQAVPSSVARTDQRYVRPLVATPDAANACLHKYAYDERLFGDCMLNNMLGDREYEVFRCSQLSDDQTEVALCIVGAIGGENEKKAATQLGNCYAENGDNWSQYPLCMAQENMNADTARLLACVQKQANQGSVTFFGTATCYGVQSLRLTPEQQIAVECAMSSGGEPMTFAGCAGGQLTVRELNKCLMHGVGSHDCFGPNNEIVKALNNVGIDIGNQFGPNNDLVKLWNNGVNDLRNGPGPSNDLVRAANTIANDISNGPGQNNDIVKAIDNVIPGFKNLF